MKSEILIYLDKRGILDKGLFMGKSSPKEKEMFTAKQRRRTRASSKYLRPGALAQLRYSKSAATKACTDLGKKRIAVGNDDLVTEEKVVTVPESQLMMSPQRFRLSVVASPVDHIKQNSVSRTLLMSPQKFGLSVVTSPADLVKKSSVPKTPRTPRIDDCESESRLEALPMDLLVNILCHLHHDHLKAVFHVSQRVRAAAIFARQFYFNYTTPDRSRQEILQTMTPVATEHWPLRSKGGRADRKASPHTPKAPRHGPRPPSRLKYTEMRQVAAALFQETSIPTRSMVPSVLSKPSCNNRVLFYEEELCQAVVQNKLL